MLAVSLSYYISCRKLNSLLNEKYLQNLSETSSGNGGSSKEHRGKQITSGQKGKERNQR